MKSAVALILAMSAAAVMAAPQYGGSNNRPSRPRPQQQKCRVIKDIEYREEFETKCNTIYEYQLCVPTSRNQCDNKRRQKCKDNWRTEYDTEKYQVCDDRPQKVCEKHWEEDGKGGKVWADDPSTCKTVYKTQCRDETRQVPRREKYQTCDWETYQDCYAVAGPDDCQYPYPKQQCYGRQSSVKGAKCTEKPKQDCREVHKEVPYQTERRVCPGDADWDDVRDTVGGSFSPSVIANAFNQATNNIQRGEIEPVVRKDKIDDYDAEEIIIKSATANSEEEEEDHDDDEEAGGDAIHFG